MQKNMPRGEGQEPEIIMLIENISYVYMPRLEDIKIYDDTIDTIGTNKGEKYVYKRKSQYSNNIEYIYVDENNIAFRWSRKFDLSSAYNIREVQKVDIESIDKERLILDIKNFLSPVIEAQPKPKVNLQWLFNFIYEDDFK